MLQRRCSVCMPSWHQRSLLPSTRSRQNNRRFGGILWKSARRTSTSTTYHAKRLDYVGNNNFLKHNARRQLSSARPTVSEAQRRSAQLELDRMDKSTSRLLAMDLLKSSEGVGEKKTMGKGKAIISAAIINEVRVALNYWSRRWYMHFHPGFGRAAKGSALSLDVLRNKWNGGDGSFGNVGVEGGGIVQHANSNAGDDEQQSSAPSSSVQNVSGDFGARQAERLLDWSMSNNLVTHGIFDQNSEDILSHMEEEDLEGGNLGSSPNLTCVNIIETYLLPTAYGGVGGVVGAAGMAASGSVNADNMDRTLATAAVHDQHNFATLTKHFTINSSYVRAVVDATRVMQKMKRLQSDFPDKLSPDTLSIKAELNVWSKRAMIFARNQNIGGGGIVAGSVVDGVAGIANNDSDPKDMLKALELEYASANGGEVYGDDAYTLQGCLDKMESILSRAEEQYNSTEDERICPSVDWYNHVLGAWARSDLGGALEKTKQILRGMETYDDALVDNRANERIANGSLRQCWASPDTISYNSVLFCLARDSGKGRAKEAEALLHHMKERCHETKNVNIQPDEVTYGAVLHALAQEGMAREAESILDSLEDDAAIIPSLTIYNTVLNAWANSPKHNAPKHAESLLDRMKVLRQTGKNPTIEPDAISISTVISCHARSKTRKGAERAERMLNEAIAMYLDGNSRVKPDSIMFNCAITGWTNISGIESEQGGISSNEVPAERAESLLLKMKDTQLDVRPVAQTFNIILDCWAKSEMNGATERAVKLMREMPDYCVAPDECSYNSVLHAMTKESDPKWVKRAEEMFEEMKEKVSVSQITYHVMMNIYGKSKDKDGARKAEELLRRMVQEKDISPSDISYNICIDAYARRGDHVKAASLLEEMISLSDKGNGECRPTIHSFASVVNALAKSGDVDAVARAEEVVSKVEELKYVSPNSILYNSLIDCMVKSRRKDSASRAEEILLKMEQMNRSGHSDVRPNSYAYSMVLTCCARSNEQGAAERAERILRNMETLYAEGLSDAVANSRCYSAAISAWARSESPNAVERAFALIDRMEQNGRDGTPHGKPNAHCYNACIHAIAKSHNPGKARQCREVLERMITAKDTGFYEAAPSLITYSTIINACAFTNGNEEDKREAFDLARTCFQTLLESNEMEPCVSTFTNFFLVINRHLKRGAVRDQFAEAVFLEGCNRGKVDMQVWNNFRKASPSASDRVSSEHETFPAEWKRNIKSDGFKTY